MPSRGFVSASVLVAAATAAVCLPVADARAVLVLQTSSAVILHNSGFGESSRQIDVPTLPAYVSNFYQYSTTNSSTPPLTNGQAVSTARFGLGVVNSPTFVGIGFAAGTALTQRGNTNSAASSASTLDITFSATWINEVTPCGSGLQAGGSFGFIGSIPTGGNAFVGVSLTSDFVVTVPGGGASSLRGAITPTPFFFRNNSGTFTFSRSDLLPASLSSLPIGTILTVSGNLQLRVHNDGEEASIELDGPAGLAGGDDPMGFIPTPGAAAILGLGMLAGLRRRRD